MSPNWKQAILNAVIQISVIVAAAIAMHFVSDRALVGALTVWTTYTLGTVFGRALLKQPVNPSPEENKQ